jgi:hypothetical protein
MRFVVDLSRLTCHLVTGAPESWCSLAYRYRDRSRLACLWIAVFGPSHCRKSHEHYWG